MRMHTSIDDYLIQRLRDENQKLKIQIDAKDKTIAELKKRIDEGSESK